MIHVTITYTDRPISESWEVDDLHFAAIGVAMTQGRHHWLIPSHLIAAVRWHTDNDDR